MPSNTEFVPPVEWFTKTNEFRQRALFFEKHGMYTQYPKGTDIYNEFWAEEDYRCKHGYTNSVGITITGVHYFYLNYVQIKLKDKETGRKKMGFPRFLDVDYDFFHLVEVARQKKKGLIFSKPRRGGFSYKDAALVTHEYNFYRDSTCVIGAFLEKLATQTMSMVLDNMNFLNTNTEWRKQRNPDTKEFVKARYESSVDGVKVWKGYKSEVQKLTFKDNPYASIGKTTNIFIFEEAGKFANLKESYNMTEPCWKDGDDMVGLPIIFGTGGDMEAGTADFGHMFYNPSTYNLLEFTNVWEPGKELTKCGWFIPATRGRLGEDLNTRVEMVDKDGNSIEEEAYKSIQALRIAKRMSGDPKTIQDTITQYPLTPAESFLRSSGAIFSSVEMHEWLAKLEVTPSLRDSVQKGELYFNSEGKIRWQHNPDLNAIVNYPLNKDDLKTGCITIWEHPEFADAMQIPHNLYIGGCDPIDQDKAETSNSLGSFFIYKRFYRADKTHNIIVAEYTGRPEFADQFYENCRKLCIYYNAKCLYENQLKGFKTHFEQKNCLHYLYEQPQIIKDIVKDSRVSRGYGIHMNRGANGASGIKDQCELYLRKWLYEEREIDGIKSCNLFTIKSIPLLKELVAYDREGNFDRVIALMLCILQTYELHKIIVDSELNRPMFDTEPFFSRPLFVKNKYGKLRY